MAAKSKYADALDAFIAAKAQLYNPKSTWPEYAAATEASDAAWRALAVAAKRWEDRRDPRCRT